MPDPLLDKDLSPGDIVVRRISSDPQTHECLSVGTGWTSDGIVARGYGRSSQNDAWESFWVEHRKVQEAAAAAKAAKAAAAAAKAAQDTSPDDLRVTVAKAVASRAEKQRSTLAWLVVLLLAALISTFIFR